MSSTLREMSTILLAVLFAAACDADSTGPGGYDGGISLRPGSVILYVGEEAQLQAVSDREVEPVDVDGWISLSPDIVSVDANGSLSALAIGSARVTATAAGAPVGDTAVVDVIEPVEFDGEFVAYPSDEVAFIIGPQLRSGSPANPWPWFDENWIAHADVLWEGDATGALERSHGYYYDAALVQYGSYYRTGDITVLERARHAADYWYERSVAEKEAYGGFSPRESALAGLMLRALDGRPEYWPFITSEVDRAYSMWLGSRLGYDRLYFGVRDGAYALLYAARLAVAHPDAAVRSAWLENARVAARDYYARLQTGDGGWYWQDDGSEGHPGGVWEQPFMVGLLLEALIAVHQLTGDEAVRSSILASVQHLWNGYRLNDPVPERPETTWRSVPYFVYTDGTFSAEENLAGGWDTNTIREGRQRNSLVVHAFGYAYQLTSDPTYRQRGDEVFAATYGNRQGPGADTYYGLADFRGKEYNQAYRSAGRYLAWRLGSAGT